MKTTTEDAAILAAYKKIKENAKKIGMLTMESAAALKRVEQMLVGREIKSYYTGNLAGPYLITNVELNYDASEIRVHGLKLVEGRAGKTGSQCRELGILTPARLGL